MRFRIASLLAALFLLVPALTIAQSNPSATVTISSASSTAGVSAAGGNGNGYGSCKVQVVAPSGFGTVTFEGTSGGSTQPLQAQLQVPGSAVATTATVPGLYTVDVSGMQSYDWRVSTYTSGPITFIWSCGNQPAVFVSTASGGGSYTAPPVQPVSGVGGAPVPVTTAAPYALATDSLNRIITSPSSAPSPCATATDGGCNSHITNTIPHLGGVAYNSNGTQTAQSLASQYSICHITTNSTWAGNISVKLSSTTTGNYYTRPFLNGQSTMTVPAQDWRIDVANYSLIELVISNYSAGIAYLNCDTNPGNSVLDTQQSAGIGQSIAWSSTITLTGAVAAAGAATVAVSSTTGLIPSLSVTISCTSGTSGCTAPETIPLTAVSSVAGSTTITATFGEPHGATDTVTVAAAQTITVPFNGLPIRSCTLQSYSQSGNFNGTITPQVSNDGAHVFTRPGIGALQTDYGAPIPSPLSGNAQAWSVDVGGETSVQFVVAGASAGGFSYVCDYSPPVPSLPAIGTGALVACTTGSTNSTPMTPGPFGTLIVLNSGGSITMTIAATGTTFVSPPANLFTYTAAQMPMYHWALSGQSIYVTASTNCFEQPY